MTWRPARSTGFTVPALRAGAPVDPAALTSLPGRLLQASWLAYLGAGARGALVGAEHPEPPALVRGMLGMVGAAAIAVTAGLLWRRRWAVLGSAFLALPMVVLAVWCGVADPGGHWVGEALLATGVVAGSLHPSSWRMHHR